MGAAGRGGGGPLSVSAQSNDAGDALVVRLVNPLGAPVTPHGPLNLTFAVAAGEAAAACRACTLLVLHAPDVTMANPSWRPDLVAPQELPCSLSASGDATAPLPLLPYSYSVVELRGCTA